MPDLTLRQRILKAATKLTAKFLPKPIKYPPLQSKKFREHKIQAFYISKKMSAKRDKKATKPSTVTIAVTLVPAQGSEQLQRESVEEKVQVIESKLKNLSLSEESSKREDFGHGSIKAPPSQEDTMESGFIDGSMIETNKEDVVGGKTMLRFDGYNDRLEEILKIRELMSKRARKQAIPANIEIILKEIHEKADADETDVRDNLDDANRHINQLEADCDQLNNKLNKLNDDLEKEKNKTKDLEETLRKKQDELIHEIEKKDDMLAQVQKQNADKENQRRKEKDDLQSSAKVLQQRLSSSENIIRIQEAQLGDNEENLNTKDAQIQNMFDALDKLQKAFEEALKAKNVELEEIYSKDIEAIRKNVEEAGKVKDAQIKNLQEQITKLEEKNAELAKKNAKLEDKLKDSGKDRTNHDELVANLEKKLADIGKKNKNRSNLLRGVRVKLALNLEPQFQRYNGLLILEEKRLDVLKDDNNNVKA